MFRVGAALGFGTALLQGAAAVPTTLHEALEKIPPEGGDFSIFDDLVAQGADLNSGDEETGQTPLMRFTPFSLSHLHSHTDACAHGLGS